MVQWVSRAPPHQTLPAILNLNGFYTSNQLFHPILGLNFSLNFIIKKFRFFSTYFYRSKNFTTEFSSPTTIPTHFLNRETNNSQAILLNSKFHVSNFWNLKINWYKLQKYSTIFFPKFKNKSKIKVLTCHWNIILPPLYIFHQEAILNFLFMKSLVCPAFKLIYF